MKLQLKRLICYYKPTLSIMFIKLITIKRRYADLSYMTSNCHRRPNITGKSHPRIQSGCYIESTIHAELGCSL